MTCNKKEWLSKMTPEMAKELEKDLIARGALFFPEKFAERYERVAKNLTSSRPVPVGVHTVVGSESGEVQMGVGQLGYACK